MQSLITRQLEISGRTITLQLPADPEQLLNDAAEAGADADPYWGVLWDAAAHTANCVLQTDWPTGQRVLEVGCGTGLVGIAALIAGLDVTFSDLVPEAVALAISNAAKNGFPNVPGKAFDWRDGVDETFDVLLASDVLYDASVHEPLLTFARAALKPQGRFWIGDPGRQKVGPFINLASERSWKIELRNRDLEPVITPTVADFQLIVLS